jgi:Spy/CpxP family protein refolding chaperone
MNKLIVAALAFLLFTTAASAQERKPKANHDHGKKMEKGAIAKKLNMTEAQKTQVKMYQQEYKAKLGVLDKNDQMTMGDYKKQKAQLQADKKTKMGTVLTTDQKNQVAQFKAEKKVQHKEKQEKKMKALQTKLNLTEVQVKDMAARKEQAQKEIATIKANQSLTKEDRKIQIKALKVKQKEGFVSSLTAEQKQQLEQLKQQKQARKKK